MAVLLMVATILLLVIYVSVLVSGRTKGNVILTALLCANIVLCIIALSIVAIVHYS